MCGRTCLTLDANQVICACKYSPENKTKQADGPKLKEPVWRAEYNLGRSFTPSYNIAPTDICPVLVSGQHFQNTSSGEDNFGRVIVPMMWGMIPAWHRGDYRKHGLTTNNCRLEHMMNSKLYSGPYQRGQRCVILCEGFYEWETTKMAKPSQRAAYFLYAPQTVGVRIFDKSTWSPDNVRLLKLAGLYDIWENDDGDKIFSYSVITFDSSALMSWLHHRMPAILDTEQQIDDWLDYKRINAKAALDLLRPATQLVWHRVSNLVNNSRNKDQECNKPMELVKNVPRNKLMNAWLKSSKRPKEGEDEQKQVNDTKAVENPAKRSRLDDMEK